MNTDALMTAPTRAEAERLAAWYTERNKGTVQVCESKGYHYVERDGTPVRSWESLIARYAGGKRVEQ